MTTSNRVRPTAPDFNFIARPYRWLEYCTFGRLLAHCRFAQLARMQEAGSALVLGDGDGRFLAKLLAINPALQADVVDISETMLRLARARMPKVARARLQRADIRAYTPPAGRSYDLVVTHFFLDCLSEREIAELIERLKPHLSPQAIWVVSEFAIPARGLSHVAGRLLVQALYLAFRLLTGLEVQRLPRYALLLEQAGFVCEDASIFLGGILRSECWRCITSS